MEPFPIETIESIWRMQRLVNHIARPFDTRKGQEFKLTLSQFRVMRAIAVYPEISAQEICEFDGVNSMLVSRAVGMLEKRGWVVRTTDAADGRRMKLSLTVQGRDAFSQMFPNMEASYLNVLSPLNNQERITLDVALQKMLAHVNGEEIPTTLRVEASADAPPPAIDKTLLRENQNLREMLIDLQMENHQLKKQLAVKGSSM